MLSKTTETIAVGDTLRLTATVVPNDATNKTTAWVSSDTAIAAVSNGLITALAAGTADRLQ